MRGRQAVLYAARPVVLDAPSLYRAICEDEAGLSLDDALSQLDAARACVVAPDEPFNFDRRGGLLPSPLVCELMRRGGLALKRYDAGESGSLVVVALIEPCTWMDGWTDGTAGAAEALGAAPVCCNAEHFRAAAAGGAVPRWNALRPMQPKDDTHITAAAAASAAAAAAAAAADVAATAAASAATAATSASASSASSSVIAAATAAAASDAAPSSERSCASMVPRTPGRRRARSTSSGACCAPRRCAMRSVHVSCAMFASRHASSQAAHAAGLADRAVLTFEAWARATS